MNQGSDRDVSDSEADDIIDNSDLDPHFIEEGGQSSNEQDPSTSRSRPRPGSNAKPNKRKRLNRFRSFNV